MKLKLLIAAWNSLPMQHRIYYALGLGVVLIVAMLLGYGAQVFEWVGG